MYQRLPVINTDEDVPAIRPMMIGSENYLREGTPITKSTNIVMNVVSVEYILLVRVCVIEVFTIFLTD